MFEKARLKLTAWYLVIIMAVSLVFSLGIYQNINNEYIRFDRSEKTNQEWFEHQPPLGRSNFQRINFDEARARLITSLILVNLIILVSAGLGGYFLAGKTLRPIKKMMEDQNRFVSDASHELRTPITAMKSETEVALRNKNLTIKAAKQTLLSNLEEVENLQKLSDYLILLAQNELQDNTYFDVLDLYEILSISISKVEKIAKAKSIEINLAKGRANAIGDREELIKLFVILLDNAIKYSPKKSKINLIARENGGKIEVIVEDNGIGMDKETQERIFDRFYRAEESRSEEGYGLGLSIAQKIVAEHSGEISVESKKGKGTKFIVLLPSVKD